MDLAQKQASSKLKQGERLGGKYSLVRRLAVGGMGQIWLAKNEMTDAEVALKVLRPDAAPDADATGDDVDLRRAHLLDVEPRFRHEAKLGAMLSHRNIVRIFDFIEEPDGSLVLVMELLRGETLADLIAERGTVSPVEAVAILMPILSALEHAHEVGVVHRDLKPANIMLAVDPDGHVTPKLLDFGIAKVPVGGVHTLEGGVLGTPRYMSPEQIRAEDKIDGRSDLFTIGILLYEMLTGGSPFAATSPSASLAAVLETQLDPDPRIDPRLWLVIQRALAKRAYERFATAGELAQSLRAAIPETDKELAATLQRAKPAPRASASLEGETPVSQILEAHPVTEDGASLEIAGLPASSPSLRKLLIAGAVLSLVAIVGAASILGRSSSPPVAAGAGKIETPTAVVIPAVASAPASAVTTVATVATEPRAQVVPAAHTAAPRDTASTSRKPLPAVTGVRRNPRVATTPGF
ncbi:MAG: serine/threonine protein kinase [Myxococcaceae bacterium]|nr:serine/threonine protein kinase [Myxococcaceae bacterium]